MRECIKLASCWHPARLLECRKLIVSESMGCTVHLRICNVGKGLVRKWTLTHTYSLSGYDRHHVWVNYNDLRPPHSKWWFMWGIAPQPPYFRLLKYYNSPRLCRGGGGAQHFFLSLVGMFVCASSRMDSNEVGVELLQHRCVSKKGHNFAF